MLSVHSLLHAVSALITVRCQSIRYGVLSEHLLLCAVNAFATPCS